MADIDTTILGKLSAEVMEAIEDRFDGEDFHLRTVAVVAEVDGPQYGQFVVRCSDDRPWYLSAFLAEACDSVDRAREDAYQEYRRQVEDDGDADG